MKVNNPNNPIALTPIETLPAVRPQAQAVATTGTPAKAPSLISRKGRKGPVSAAVLHAA